MKATKTLCIVNVRKHIHALFELTFFIHLTRYVFFYYKQFAFNINRRKNLIILYVFYC